MDLTMTYILPLTLMTYWNIRIGLVLKSSTDQWSGEGVPQSQLESMAEKRKVC